MAVHQYSLVISYDAHSLYTKDFPYIFLRSPTASVWKPWGENPRPTISHAPDGRTYWAGFETGTKEYEMGGNSPGVYLASSLHTIFHFLTSPTSAVTPAAVRGPVSARRFEHIDSNHAHHCRCPVNMALSAARPLRRSTKKWRRRQ